MRPMKQDFPIATFLEIKRNLGAARNHLEKEKAAWRTVRNTLTEAEKDELDKQFKATFENVEQTGNDRSVTKAQDTLHSLQQLVKKGASAHLMGNSENGPYNLAMLIVDIASINDKEELRIVADIIRTTIIADADLFSQEAYWGNGGINALEWLCILLAHGIDQEYTDLRTIDQYHCCYNIFPMLADQTQAIKKEYASLHPFDDFLISLRVSPQVTDLQEKIILHIICLDWAPLAKVQEYFGGSFFRRLAIFNIDWLTMLYPFEHEHLKSYIAAVLQNLDPTNVKYLLNSFTIDNKTRKHFRACFSQRPHWLLKHIVSSIPDIIFDLIRRNEKELLAPFLKHYKRELVMLQNKNGHTLLQHAMTSRGVVENTVQLLRQAGLVQSK
ncbi:hypothetical protein [Chitinophaga sp. S165]|uniref:hypothetical protein n=1 Tax=Chitinophaga sp. S165 TaxID=2135462 RepID=UPI000D9AE946|nr:hypothetical protein [Chitinophaga sp. S165]PWV48279.1 hypothetical protein C7475_107185 [Chitinophaga sp. S165]